MPDVPSDPAVEARLRDWLTAELTRAEADFPSVEIMRPSRTRTRRTYGLALAPVVAVIVAVILVVPRSPGPVANAPGGPPLGDDGLPLSIAGEPVLRDAAIAAQAETGAFLAGGTLVLNTGLCGSRSARAQLGCGEDWSLVSGSLENPSFVFTLDGAPAAPNFVRTSGAPTVIRVGPPLRIPNVLTVDAIAWREPTKGPIPEAATTRDGGTNEALVPDFVSVWAADGATIAGYVTKRDLLEGPSMTPGGTPSNPPQALPIPVYGDDLVTLVGHSVPGIGFVALGSTVSPVPATPSLVPASVRPSALPSAGSSDEPPVVECGRIGPGPCAKAIALARAADPEEVRGASPVVVDDVCPPTVVCDREYAFDSLAVFVTAGADTTGWIPIQVTGREYNMPTDAKRSFGDIPAHIVALLTAIGPP